MVLTKSKTTTVSTVTEAPLANLNIQVHSSGIPRQREQGIQYGHKDASRCLKMQRIQSLCIFNNNQVRYLTLEVAKKKKV